MTAWVRRVPLPTEVVWDTLPSTRHIKPAWKAITKRYGCKEFCIQHPAQAFFPIRGRKA